MKSGTFSLITASVVVVIGASAVIAQPLRPPEPIVVQIVEVDREAVRLRPEPKRSPIDLTLPLEEQRAFLSFYCPGKSQEEVGALVQDGVRSKRSVRIMDGCCFVAEGRVVGHASFQKNASVTRYGFLLRFDSLSEAERAAAAMREDVEHLIDRMLQDRRSWRI